MVKTEILTTIFIGGINRSGGSLLARLFDGHEECVSYPLEIHFPHDDRFYKIFEYYTGNYISVPDYNGSKEIDVYELMEIPRRKPEAELKWGKEHSDPLGVRKNYIEKGFYDKIKTNFDYDEFIRLFDRYRENAMTIAELYDARHRAYFQSWDRGGFNNQTKYVIMHSSGGFYLSNIDKFFKEFEGSAFIHPVRDVMGYIASEKTRLARRYFGSRRFSYPKFPNAFVKIYSQYNLEAQVRAWMTALTRTVLLQEKYGVDNRFIVYSNEQLVQNPESVMKVLGEKTGISYNQDLLEPAIGGHPWGGNSHQGKSKGINKDLLSYYPKVLREKEIKYIEKQTGKIRNFIRNNTHTPLDLTNLPKEWLWDYKYQKKYFNDEEKIVLYSAFVNSGRRQDKIKPPKALALLAYVYAKVIWLIHVPRLLKMRFFPGWGKQNYT